MIKHRIYATLLGSFLLLNALAPLAKAEIETFDPKAVRDGMTGYGLSVFKGVQPARFEFEVVGRLENSFYDQDLILIKMSGQNLELHKIIAGMSGSPVYLEGKLLGAVAYGWSFPNEALAGVTPAVTMLRDMGRTRAERNADLKSKPSVKEPPSPLKRLRTPLWVSGLSASLMEPLGKMLDPYGLEPQPGSSSGPTGADGEGPDRFEPGSSIAVPLVRGDWNAAAVGTVTFIDGDAVAAFGHPFFNWGNVRLPMYTSSVAEIFSGSQRSFKFGAALKEVGAIRGDYQSAIIGFYDEPVSMVPVRIHLEKTATGQVNDYSVEIVDDENLTPMFMMISVSEAVTTSLPDNEEAMVEAELIVTLQNGEKYAWSDRFRVRGNALPNPMFSPLSALLGNRFQKVRLASAEVKLTLESGRKTADILEALPDRVAVLPGSRLGVSVKIRPYEAPEYVQRIEVKIPQDSRPGQRLFIEIGSGQSIAPSTAPPTGYAQLAESVRKYYRNDTMVARIVEGGYGFALDGQLLPNLPPTARERLMPSATRSRRHKRAQKRKDALLPNQTYNLFGKTNFTVTVLPSR